MSNNYTVIPFGVDSNTIITREQVIASMPTTSIKNLQIRPGGVSESSTEVFKGTDEFNSWTDWMGTWKRLQIVGEHVYFGQPDPPPDLNAGTDFGAPWTHRIINWVFAGIIATIAIFSANRARTDLKKAKEQEALLPALLLENTERNFDKINRYLANAVISRNFIDKSKGKIRKAEFHKLEGHPNAAVLVIEDAPGENKTPYEWARHWFDKALTFFALPAYGFLWDAWIFSILIFGACGISAMILGSSILAAMIWVALPLILGPANLYGRQMYNWLHERFPPSENPLVKWLYQICFKPIKTNSSVLNFLGEVFTSLIRSPLGFVCCCIGMPAYYLIYRPLIKPFLKNNGYQQLNQEVYKDDAVSNQKAANIKELLNHVEEQLQLEQALRPIHNPATFYNKSTEQAALKAKLFKQTAALNVGKWTTAAIIASSSFFSAMTAFVLAQMGIYFWQIAGQAVGWAGAMTLSAFGLGIASFVVAAIRGIFVAIDTFYKYQGYAKLYEQNNLAIKSIFERANKANFAANLPELIKILEHRETKLSSYQKAQDFRTVTGPSQSVLYVLRSIVLPNTAYLCFGAITVAALGGPIAFIGIMVAITVFSILVKYLQYRKEQQIKEAQQVAQRIVACNDYLDTRDPVNSYDKVNRITGQRKVSVSGPSIELASINSVEPVVEEVISSNINTATHTPASVISLRQRRMGQPVAFSAGPLSPDEEALQMLKR